VDPILSQIPFAEFLDQIPDGLFVTDVRRRILLWNRAAGEITGFSPDGLLGRYCYEEEAPGFRTLLGQDLGVDENCPLLQSIAKNRDAVVPPIVLMNTKGGKTVPVSLRVGPLRGADGEATGSIVLFRDMREEYQQRKLAMEIQKRTVTRGALRRGGVRVQALFAPVEEIGGDFIEAFFLDDGSLIATVADATGHGISSSLFTIVFKTLLHSAVGRSHEPGKILDEINHGFLQIAGIEGYYMSACIVRFDPGAGSGSYAAAGHPEGLIFSRDGEGLRLRAKLHIQSFMLGIEEDTRYEEMGFSLEPGELLLLASDGLFESECYDGKAFGVPGVQRFFAHRQGERPLEELLAEVRGASRFPVLPDDVSILAVSAE
jgi:PAS domain S-box-containing protein